jgi:hypothetical protein
LKNYSAPRLSAPESAGPAPELQRQLEQIQALPAAKQRAIAQVLDSVLASQ